MADFTGAQYAADEVRNYIKTDQITGIPPKNLDAFLVKNNGTGSLKISVKSGDTVLEGQTVCTCAGVRVIRKKGSAPKNINDGEVVFDHAGSGVYEYEDKGLSDGSTYYYQAFPYSDHGVYNRSAANVRKGVPEPVHYWAFDQNFSDRSPDSSISYPIGFENYGIDPMLTNEGTAKGAATAGGWASFLTETLRNYPYMVHKDGSADYALDPDDYTKRADDGQPSDYDNTDYEGGAFAWLNKIWMKEEYTEDGESRRVTFADSGTEGFHAIGFHDGTDELEGIWLPMGYMDAAGRTLISGTTPCASKTCEQEWVLLQQFSSRARFLGGPIINVLRDLLYMLFRSTDIQGKAGHGRCNAGTSAVIANAVVTNGAVQGWKGTNDQKTMNKYFHSQLLGSYQQWIRDPYTLLIAGKMLVNRYYQYNLAGIGYDDPNISWPTDSAWYYPSHLQYLGDGHGSTPKHENTGTSATGLCDGVYSNAAGTRVALRLGACLDALLAGPASLSLSYEASLAVWNIGAGCALLPSAGYAPA